MAKRLATIVPWEIAHPVETNAVFVRMDEQTHRRLLGHGWVVFRLADGTVRFMCSWATTEASLAELAQVFDAMK